MSICLSLPHYCRCSHTLLTGDLPSGRMLFSLVTTLDKAGAVCVRDTVQGTAGVWVKGWRCEEVRDLVEVHGVPFYSLLCSYKGNISFLL